MKTKSNDEPRTIRPQPATLDTRQLALAVGGLDSSYQRKSGEL